MLIRIYEKGIDFDNFRHMIINSEFGERQLLSSIILQKGYVNATKILF